MNNRILALDVMRGMTIVGMILFNTCSGFHYAPLYHASWIGLTLADMAFPFFMFIMGMTTYLSLSKYGFKADGRTVRKILSRTAGIILVCWAFDWLYGFLFAFFGGGGEAGLWERFVSAADRLESLRLSGVLVRLGLCYGICALASLWVNHRRFPMVVASLLLGYFIILLFGHGFEREAENILGIVDRALLGEGHMYNDGGIDPEGVLSTLPSVAHTMLGFWVGSRLFDKAAPLTTEAKANFLYKVGAVLVVFGFLFSCFCPLSKKIWSPSFVMVTCGMGSLLLGMLINWIDGEATSPLGGKCRNGVASYFRIFGANPLFLYLLSEAILWPLELIKINVGGEQTDIWGAVFWKCLVPVFGNYGGDLVFALLNVLFCWLVGLVLYRCKIFIKL